MIMKPGKCLIRFICYKYRLHRNLEGLTLVEFIEKTLYKCH